MSQQPHSQPAQSQLHLIKWDRVLIDDAMVLKRGTVRFDALLQLSSIKRWAIFCDLPSGQMPQKVTEVRKNSLQIA